LVQEVQEVQIRYSTKRFSVTVTYFMAHTVWQPGPTVTPCKWHSADVKWHSVAKGKQ